MHLLTCLSQVTIGRRFRKGRGFTLLELLVAVVVIGILASLALIKFGSAQEKAYVATMQSDLRNFATARAIHLSETDALPGSAAGVTGYNFSDLVFQAGYEEDSATEWALLVGHNKTETRCVMSTFQVAGQDGAQRISCARDLALDFSATSSGSTVTVDATQAINSLAFAPDEKTGAAFAARSEDIAVVSWEYGDGVAEGGDPATYTTRTHSYAKPGEYTVRLTLVKKTGEVRTGAKTAEVTGIANQAPVASFTVDPASPETGVAVTFASTSTDANGDPLTLTWDIAGTAASGASAQATFATAGTYTVKLTASDGKGGTHTASQDVVVAQANRAPVADFTVSPSTLHAGEQVTFTSTSTDPDNDNLTYSWDFGDFSPLATTATATHAYAAEGEYVVSLTVSDGKGGSSTKLDTLAVAAAVPPIGTAGRISTGSHFSCAISSKDDKVYCWGGNYFGELGDGTTTGHASPAAVSGTLTFANLSVSTVFSCALTSGGQAYCWGHNGSGQLGDNTLVDKTIPNAVGGGLLFQQISAGGNHACGITSSGTAYCWGNNSNGQLGDNSTTSRRLPTLVAGGLSFASISTGDNHTCGVTTGGAAYCWGAGADGKLGTGNTTQRLVPTAVAGGLSFKRVVAMGGNHSCGVTTGGAGYCWGRNDLGQVGDGTSTARTSPTAVAGGMSFASIEGGYAFSCGLTTAGAVYCWGEGSYGQMGNGTTTQVNQTPTAVSGGHTFYSLGGGGGQGNHMCAISTGGSSYCWGYNGNGQIGNGITGGNQLLPGGVGAF